MIQAQRPLGNNRLSNIVLLIALIISSANHAYFTITFPTLSRELNIKDLDGSLVLSLSALVLMIFSPSWGWLCEYWGRKKAIFIGLTASVISSISLAYVVYYHSAFTWGSQMLLVSLLTIRILHTLCSAGIKPAAQATIADLTAANWRVKGMGVIGAAFGIGTIIGGFLAILTGSLYLLQGFLIASLLSMISALLLMQFFQESRENSSPPKLKVRQCLNLWPYLLITLISLSMYSALQQITTWRLLDSFGMPSHKAAQFNGAIMMSTMLVMILAQGILVLKLNISAQKLRLLGTLITASALTSAAFAVTPLMLLASMLMLGLGLGVLLPANLALLSLSAQDNQQGQVAGINGAFMGMGLALGPITGAFLFSANASLPYTVFATAFALLAIIFGLFNKKMPCGTA